MNTKGRVKQFSGLVDSCEICANGNGKKMTIVVGFWDMIYFQVQTVDKMRN